MSTTRMIKYNKRCPEQFSLPSLSSHGLPQDLIVQYPLFCWIRKKNATPLVYVPGTVISQANNLRLSQDFKN